MSEANYHIIIYAAYFIAAAMFSFLLNGVFVKFATTLGIRNKSETVIRWSSKSKPALGGISFFIIFLLSIASYNIFFENSTVLLNRQLLGLLAACTMAFLMGLADDAYNTKPLLKISVQIFCAIILIYTGTFIKLFSDDIFNYALTILWVVGIMNSINMLDNMDAISTLVSIFILSSGIIVRYFQNDFYGVYILILVGVVASLCGFLFYNWHPSKLFMGDTGSQFLGVILAASGIICFINAPDASGNTIFTKQIISAALVFIIPITDTVTVVVNRLRKKRSPFIGGKDHTTHHLFYLGVTEKRIAVLFSFICFLSMIFVIIINNYIVSWNWLHIILFSSYFLLVFSLLFYASQLREEMK